MKPSTRVAVLVASLVAVVALFALLQPDGNDQLRSTPSASTPAATASATGTDRPSPTASATATPDAVEIEVEVEDGRVEGRAEYTVSTGERVRIQVGSDTADEVHVHGYDLIDDVAPGSPAVIVFRADAPGVFEVELEGAGRLLFRLRVTP